MRSRVFDLSTYALARLPQMEFVQVVLVSPATEFDVPVLTQRKKGKSQGKPYWPTAREH